MIRVPLNVSAPENLRDYRPRFETLSILARNSSGCRKRQSTKKPAVAGFSVGSDESVVYSDRTHSTRSLASSSLTGFGGIGMVPHTPPPPLITFLISVASASLSPLYFLAISV